MKTTSILSRGALALALILVAGTASAATIESGSIDPPMPNDGINWTQNVWGDGSVRDIPQDLAFEVPNIFRWNYFKTVWLAVTYTEFASDAIDSAPELLPGASALLGVDDLVIDLTNPANQGASFTTAVSGAAIEGGDWVAPTQTGAYERTVTYYQTWTITPQPCSEELFLSNMLGALDDFYSNNGIDFALNTVEIRTVCKPIVPEPATMSLLALGLAGLGARRVLRRRK